MVRFKPLAIRAAWVFLRASVFSVRTSVEVHERRLVNFLRHQSISSIVSEGGPCSRKSQKGKARSRYFSTTHVYVSSYLLAKRSYYNRRASPRLCSSLSSRRACSTTEPIGISARSATDGRTCRCSAYPLRAANSCSSSRTVNRLVRATLSDLPCRCHVGI